MNNGPHTTDPGAAREMEDRIRAELAVLERKSSRLQRRVGLLSLAVTLLVVLLALSVLAPRFLSTDTGRVLEANRIRLLDVDGSPRGEWAVDAQGDVRLSLLDRSGQQRLNLTVLNSGFPGLALVNDAGQRRAVLGLLPDQTTTLVFADVKGTPRAVLGLTSADAANLVFADAEGISRMGMGLDGKGTGSVMMPSDSVGGSIGPASLPLSGSAGGGR